LCYVIVNKLHTKEKQLLLEMKKCGFHVWHSTLRYVIFKGLLSSKSWNTPLEPLATFKREHKGEEQCLRVQCVRACTVSKNVQA